MISLFHSLLPASLNQDFLSVPDLPLTQAPCLSLHCLPSGSSYYDNVRPLAYPDSDAVLICFDISRPETLDSVLKKVGDLESRAARLRGLDIMVLRKK